MASHLCNEVRSTVFINTERCVYNIIHLKYESIQLMRVYRSIYGSRNGEDLMRNHIVSHRIQIHGIILKNRFFHMEIMKIYCVTLNDEIQIVHIHACDSRWTDLWLTTTKCTQCEYDRAVACIHFCHIAHRCFHLDISFQHFYIEPMVA